MSHTCRPLAPPLSKIMGALHVMIVRGGPNVQTGRQARMFGNEFPAHVFEYLDFVQ